MIVTVTHQDTSKNGKPRVYFGGKNNWQDAYYVGARIDTPKVGMTIDAVTASKNFDGSEVWFLNGWKEVSSKAAPTSEGASGALKHQTSPAKPAGWDIPTGDLSRFVSNVVGSAIAASLIQKPEDMHPWIAATYRALEAVREGKPLDFDDPAPRMTLAPVLESFSGPDPSEEQGFDDDEPPF